MIHLLRADSLRDSGMGVFTNEAIFNVNNAPSFLRKYVISDSIMRSSSFCSMVPSIALKGNSKSGQSKVNPITSHLMLKQVGNIQGDKHLLSHGFDIRTISRLKLFAYIARGKALLCTQKHSATVRAAAGVIFFNTIAGNGFLLTTKGTSDSPPAMGKLAILVAIGCFYYSRGAYNLFSAVLTGGNSWGVRCFTAFNRAIKVSGCLTHFYEKVLMTLWALFLYTVLSTFHRAVHSPRATGWQVFFTATLTDSHGTPGAIALHRAVMNDLCFRWLAVKCFAAALANNWYERTLPILGTFRPSHCDSTSSLIFMDYTIRTGHCKYRYFIEQLTRGLDVSP
jgi:hypothetical protein